MLCPMNLRGYAGYDPLDRLPPIYRYLLAMAVTAVVSMVLVILITRVFRLVQFAGLWVNYVRRGHKYHQPCSASPEHG